MKIIYFLLINLFYYSQVLAAPSLTNASGSFAEDGTVIISGAGFSTNSAVGTANLQWMKDNIESGTTDQLFSGGDGWSMTTPDADTVGVYYDNTQAHSGTQSLSATYVGGVKENGSIQYTPGSGMVSVFISAWVRGHRETDSEGQWKIIRVANTGNPAGTDPLFYFANWNVAAATHWGLFIYGNGIDARTEETISSGYTPGGGSNTHWDEWVRVDMYGIFSDCGTANGTLQYTFQEPGVIITTPVNHNGDVMTCGSGETDTWLYTIFGHYAGDGHNGLTTYYDDVFIQVGTQARVEIGDASTWATCTHREIQPPTAWADGEITITANVGSFQDGDHIYLYVVDATGAVNADGYDLGILGAETNVTKQHVGYSSTGRRWGYSSTGVSVQ